MAPSKYMAGETKDETMDAQLYVAHVRQELNQLSSEGMGHQPINKEQASAVKNFFDDLDQEKMQKGLEAFGLSMPELNGKSLKHIMSLGRDYPKDHKRFEPFLRANGFYPGDAKGSHFKYHHENNPKQWITYSAHAKLGSTGKSMVAAMQTFMLKDYMQKMEETLTKVPKRFARTQRKRAKQARKQLYR